MTTGPQSRTRWRYRFAMSRARREAIRTTLWIVPSAMVAMIVGLFVLTYGIDQRVAAGALTLPGWMTTGSADATRQALIAIAASAITVAGVVFSITILVLQLASQQFGPRMLRNFIRDLGTQISLGAFVATFVYSVIALTSVASPPPREFIPHVSATVATALTLIDLGVLIYFIHHVAASIQLTSVVSGIARDFRVTLAHTLKDAERAHRPPHGQAASAMPDDDGGAPTGAPVVADTSGFLQAIGHGRLVVIATSSSAVIRLIRRPGHFVVKGELVAVVEPPAAAAAVAKALARANIVGPNRTLTQDLGFAIDQLVEIAIRALSPAVNDPFTALNCIDWLGDCLCLAAAATPLPDGIYRDGAGEVRLVEPVLTMERLIKGASDKIRQAGHGMPAVIIRQLENLQKIMAVTTMASHRAAVRRQADMIMTASDGSIDEEADRRDVRTAYDAVIAADVRLL